MPGLLLVRRSGQSERTFEKAGICNRYVWLMSGQVNERLVVKLEGLLDQEPRFIAGTTDVKIVGTWSSFQTRKAGHWAAGFALGRCPSSRPKKYPYGYVGFGKAWF